MTAPNLSECLTGFVDDDIEKLAIAGFSLDSRTIQPGEVFVAMSGSQTDGSMYIEQAVASGASAVLVNAAGDGDSSDQFFRNARIIPVNDLARHLGPIAKRFYLQDGAPSSIVAVTGTNGKTTISHLVAQAVVHMSHQVLEAGLVGTLGAGLVNHLNVSNNTTPNAIELQKLIGQMASLGVRLVALEASSHGLDQHRLNGVDITTGVWSNVSRDHLDYHGSMDAYLAAKCKLHEFESLKTVWFNLDDPVCAQLAQTCGDHSFNVRGYGLQNAAADLSVIEHESTDAGTRLTLSCGERHYQVMSPLIGRFNFYNLAAAFGALMSEGFSGEQVEDGLSQVMPVPGRLETLRMPDCPTWVIDYAHTPDALEKALLSIRPYCDGQLYLVFGCGGNRDRGKRAEMAAVADQYADRVVVTNDNPRYESPEQIVDDILQGFSGQKPEVILDREDAMRWAWEHGQVGDVILVAGKGHEPYQEVNGVRSEFSDAEMARTIAMKV